MEVLKFAFKNSEPEDISATAQMHSEDISKFLISAMGHQQAKIISDSLRVTGLFIIQLKDLEGNLGAEYEASVKTLYTAISDKFQKKDIDQEVKQNSIITMSQLLSVASKILSSNQITQITQVMEERLSNEHTRDASLRGFMMICSNETKININNTHTLVPQLISLLKKAEVQVQSNALRTILAVLKRYPENV